MKLRRLLVPLTGWILLGGCASAPSSGPRTQLEVRIRNNLVPAGAVNVYLVPRSGIERELGTIYGSGTQTLRYEGLPLQGDYQLVAKLSNRTISSNILVLTKVTEIEWDLHRNYVEIVRVAEPPQ